jgi:DNA-binding transcriptional regulator YiaG
MAERACLRGGGCDAGCCRRHNRTGAFSFSRHRLKARRPQHFHVGAALAGARQRANMTQVELARRLGKPQSFVSAFEVGKRRVDVIEFLLIARTLGADPIDIFAEIVSSLPER